MKINNVYVVGLGGTGSFLAEPLVRLLTFHKDGREAKITFVDGDKYEGEVDYLTPGNHSRQIFTPAENGKYKAMATKKRLEFLNEKIQAKVSYLNSNNFKSWLEELKGEGINLFILTVKLLTP